MKSDEKLAVQFGVDDGLKKKKLAVERMIVRKVGRPVGRKF